MQSPNKDSIHISPEPCGVAADLFRYAERAALWLKQNDAADSLRSSIASLFLAEEKRITAAGGKSGEGFGASVAISGDIAVVSAPRGDGARADQGAAHIFERDRGGANNWGEVKKLTASDGQSRDEFGRSVAIDGDTIVVGASVHQVGQNEDQGAAYVFERDRGGADNWGEVKKLVAPNGEPDDFFGGSVAISNDVVVVGAAFHKTGENQNQGAAYVFERNEGGADNWGGVAQLISSDVGNDLFGLSVAIYNETVVVGASSADGAASDQGAAYVFERNQGGANKWGQSKKLTASDGRSRDQYGVSVSISVDTVVVGANVNDAGQNEDQGAAYIYERDLGGADNWGEVKKLTASDGQSEDFFGDSVAIMVNTIIIGAPNKPVGDSEFQGAAYVFERDRGGADNWGEANRLTASDGAC